MNNYGKETKDVSDKTSVFGDVLKANILSDAIKVGIKAIGDAVKGVADALKDAVAGSAEYADEVMTLSTQTGLTTDEIQVMKYQSELLDVSVDTLTGAMSRNIRSMSSNADTYKQLGINVKDSNGNLRDSTEVFYESIEALGGVSNETERDAIAMELFGKSAQDLNPLIKSDKETLEKLKDEAYNTGYVMDDLSLQKMGTMDDSFQRFQNTVTSLKNNFISQFAPSISQVTDTLSGMMNGSISAEDGVKQIAEVVKSLAKEISNSLPAILDTGIKILKAILQGIVDTLPEIMPVIVEVILELTNAIIEMLPTILEAGILILVELMKGISQALPDLIPQIVDAVILIIDVLTDNMDLIISAGFDILIALTMGIIKAIPKLPEVILKVIKAIVTYFGSYLSHIVDIGKNIVGGIWEGISGSIKWIKDKITGWVGDVFAFIKKLFGIHSPSKLMKDEVGLNIGLGVADGIEKSISAVKGAMSDLTDSAMATVTPQLNMNDITNEGINPGQITPIYLTIDTFNNNRELDIESLMSELELCRQKQAMAGGR
jgi:phage-related protein